MEKFDSMTKGIVVGFDNILDEGNFLDLANRVDEALRAIDAAARADERERCAEIADEWNWRKSGDCTNTDIATAIRAQGGAP